MRTTLFIVDDELTIRRGLHKVLEKYQMNVRLLGEASNGNEAWEKIVRLKPDIVMTDIRMPLMDGLTLVKKIYLELPETVTIILTGYKDFEFAQQALRYNVFDFLLKPCPAQEIHRVILNAESRVLENRRERRNIEAEKMLVEEHTIRSYILRLSYDKEKLMLLKEEILSRDLWVIQVESYFPDAKCYRPADLSLLQYAIRNIAEDIAQQLDMSIRFIHLVYDQFFILAESNVSHDQYAQDVKNAVLLYLGIRLAMFHSGKITDLDKLRTVFIGQHSDPTHHQRSKSIQNQWITLIMAGKLEELHAYFYRSIEDLRTADINRFEEEALSMFMAVLTLLDKEFGIKMEYDIQREWTESLRQAITETSRCHWLSDLGDYFITHTEAWLDRNNENVINKALAYIDKHYMENLSLSEISEHVHLSQSHFSSLFRRQTGESFKSYLTHYRIHKSKLLLSQSDSKITEIAQAVGYDDPNYFATVFKNLEGITPREFKKKRQS